VNIAELHAGPATLELALDDLEQLGQCYLAEVRQFLRWRTVCKRYHEEVCGCEGDACELGTLILGTSYLDPTSDAVRKARIERDSLLDPAPEVQAA
jgi:hypothetical protein